MPIDDKPIEDLTKEEIIEAISTTPQEPANSLEESAEELKALGIRDINEVDVSKAMGEAAKNMQVTKVIEDITKQYKEINMVDVLENHLKFLVKVSENKSIKDILQSMTVEHAKTVIKLNAKRDLDDKIIKKHLKTLRHKYN